MTVILPKIAPKPYTKTRESVICRECKNGCKQIFLAIVIDYPPLFIQTSKEKGKTHRMHFESMTLDTPLPPCMPFPRSLTGFSISSTAKVMYCRMLDTMLSQEQEDENGILFVCFPITAIAPCPTAP